MKKIVKIENLQKYYGKRGIITKAIDNISFDVNEGEFLGIMGASGSGKTTLLNCVSTIDSATAGKIFIEEEDVTSMKANKLSEFRREKLGFIFQDYNLLDSLIAYENIALALTILRVPANEIEGRIKKIATILNIEDILKKYPYEMSGGQRQRVAAARAIITRPSLVLADEPTGALDSRSSRILMESFIALSDELNATIMMVTHDAFTASYCQRILFLRDGKIFDEIHRGDLTRKEFFDRIMKVVALLGGELNAD